ncbi:hypothetical protein [Streptomyces glaucescens]|uniref:hypothetical protein n=1 Tax=Streptomyces glaucescens TaxID=1907 RepID=UPI000ACC744F
MTRVPSAILITVDTDTTTGSTSRHATRHDPRKQTPLFQETPIYSRLVAERGDIPTQVRGEADRILRELESVMRVASGGPLSGLPAPQHFPRPAR